MTWVRTLAALLSALAMTRRSRVARAVVRLRIAYHRRRLRRLVRKHGPELLDGLHTLLRGAAAQPRRHDEAMEARTVPFQQTSSALHSTPWKPTVDPEFRGLIQTGLEGSGGTAPLGGQAPKSVEVRLLVNSGVVLPH